MHFDGHGPTATPCECSEFEEADRRDEVPREVSVRRDPAWVQLKVVVGPLGGSIERDGERVAAVYGSSREEVARALAESMAEMFEEGVFDA